MRIARCQNYSLSPFFLASVLIYAWKAGRNTWWFAATLTVLGLFVVLNITLFASDYFTGAGINDAVLYTLTNSLTGAGVSKYILPGIGIVLGLTAVFGALGWILRRRRHHPHHFGYSLLALLLALGSVGRQPGISSDNGTGEIPVTRWRPGLCGLL